MVAMVMPSSFGIIGQSYGSRYVASVETSAFGEPGKKDIFINGASRRSPFVRANF